MDLRLSPDEFAAIRENVKEYWRLKDEEGRTGKCSYDLLALEDALGGYRWVLERLVKEAGLTDG